MYIGKKSNIKQNGSTLSKQKQMHFWLHDA